MQKSFLLKSNLRYVIVFLLVVLLIAIRFFENQLFYDPFISFFKADYHHAAKPQYNVLGLFTSLFFRFFLNSIISVAILYFLFNSLKTVKFIFGLYQVLFLVLIVAFYVFLEFWFVDWQIVFYIRRFLIQPLFLLLFVPAIFFQEMSINQKNV